MPRVSAAPRHFLPAYAETSTGIIVELKTCSMKTRSFKESKRAGRDQGIGNARVAALRGQFADMGSHLVGAQEPRLPRGTAPAGQFRDVSSGHNSYNLGCSQWARKELPYFQKDGKQLQLPSKRLQILKQ